MEISLLSGDDLSAYNTWVRNHPEGNLWQSVDWKVLQEAQKRTVLIVVGRRLKKGKNSIVCSALMTIDYGAFGLASGSIVRGPLWDTTSVSQEEMSTFLRGITTEAKRLRCLSVFIAPTSNTACPSVAVGKPSKRHIHPDTTRMIDLRKPEEVLLKEMHPKGRYNIRIAEKAGVLVRGGSLCDLDAFYDLLLETAKRDRFKILQKSHYKHFLKNLEGSFIFIAESAGKPIAGLIGVMWPLANEDSQAIRNGIYYYGASGETTRSPMAQ